MTTNTIRVGVIGAGANTISKHIPGLLAQANVEVVSVCNRSRGSSERVAQQFAIRRRIAAQRPAERDINVLKPAADAKHGNASSERGTDQGEGGAITVRVMQRARRAGRAVIQMRFDIGG